MGYFPRFTPPFAPNRLPAHREAVTQARYRLRSARHHSTFAPHVPARVIGELVLAREALKDAVTRWIDAEADGAEPLDL